MPFLPTTVLVATDGSESSRAALLAAVDLCRATSSPLHLVHAKSTSPTLRGRPMTPGQRTATEDEGEQLLKREAEAAADAGWEVEGTHLRHGDSADRVIGQVQAELGAGLLVVAAGRSGSVAGRLLRPTGAGTVRRAPGSVLVVRA
ncbi:universal stress protein [Egicoccus sp. AB-alg2]|uniref:universal stress protein n=1 Tax=Egicoccus sp. AB-alg2 TaxID=3242693 RepID=UPI00359E20D0